MKILVINPVGHDRWNSSDKKIYEKYASEGTEVDVISLPKGPESVESAEDYSEAESLIIELVKEIHADYDAVIVNCFLEPGVAKLRGLLSSVVVGPCEASLSLARNLSKKISIITVGGNVETLNMVRERIKSLGFEDIIVSLRGIPLRVLDLDRDRDATLRLLIDEARKAASEGAEVLVLGCTGLAGMAREVSSVVGVPVIDPAWAALKVAELLAPLVEGDA